MNPYFEYRLANADRPSQEASWTLRGSVRRGGASEAMSTVEKALSLLDKFDRSTPELGLSEIAKQSGFDKATTRRLLLSLAAGGFVEQDSESRLYRLGPSLLRLARLREAAFPFVDVSRPIVDELSAETGETVHVSALAGATLSTVYVCESARAHRVAVALGTRLPFNCTASGVACLAFGAESLRRAAFAQPLARLTRHSIGSVAELKRRVAEARQSGFAANDQGFEDGVSSVAAPILAGSGEAVGAISIASPTARVDAKTIERHGAAVRDAAATISAGLGGRPQRAKMT